MLSRCSILTCSKNPCDQHSSRARLSSCRHAISRLSPAYRNMGGEGVPSARQTVSMPSSCEWGEARAPRAARTATEHCFVGGWGRAPFSPESVMRGSLGGVKVKRCLANLFCWSERVELVLVLPDLLRKRKDARQSRTTRPYRSCYSRVSFIVSARTRRKRTVEGGTRHRGGESSTPWP